MASTSKRGWPSLITRNPPQMIIQAAMATAEQANSVPHHVSFLRRFGNPTCRKSAACRPAQPSLFSTKSRSVPSEGCDDPPLSQRGEVRSAVEGRKSHDGGA
jgi:hypothetical protein